MAAEDLLQNFSGEYAPATEDQESINIRGKLFERFFQIKHVTPVASNGEHLNRECSLFTDDGKYVIVGSAAYVPEEPYPLFSEVYRNNESVSPNSRSPLEDYTLHLVEISSGLCCDHRQFKCDKIFLSHNQGLYLYKNTLAVLSVQQQTIHIFQVTPNGSFIDVRTIGRFCYEDDELMVSMVRHSNSNPSNSGLRVVRQVSEMQPWSEETINSLKHRLLVFLYYKSVWESTLEGNPRPLMKFYQYFDQFRSLRMWKIQLLDETHVLIKYASEDMVTLRVGDPNSQPSFFVVYDMISTEVIAVYENTSDGLLHLFENYCDLFRNATLECEPPFMCSTSNNIHARQIHKRFKQTIINAKFGGHTEAVKRLLAQLPISAQSYSSSPYLDLSLFSYDDKWVSVMERPKTCGDHPIR